MISPVASLAPPVGLLWKLPAEINATRFDKSSLEFKLTRLSLYWTRFDADLPHRPGRVIGRLIDFKPAKEVLSGSDLTSAVLEGCFQIYNTSDSIVNISDLFQDSLLGQDRVLFCGRNRPTQIDINLPKRWLQECVNTHQKCSIYKGIKTPRYVRQLSDLYIIWVSLEGYKVPKFVTRNSIYMCTNMPFSKGYVYTDGQF